MYTMRVCSVEAKMGYFENCTASYQICDTGTFQVEIYSAIGSNPQFLEHFSVNFARSAKIDNSSVQSGEQSDFSHKIIKSNV